jgi:alpha-L-fucosidase
MILLGRFLCFLSVFALFSCESQQFNFSPSENKTDAIKEWEQLKFGAFVHFNDNTSIEKEFSQNATVEVFNPKELNFDSLLNTFKKAGVNYAVLTTRHTSGFCLWDSETTSFDVASSPYKKDIVREFVNACRKYDIKPGLYYCLWGNGWKPWEWNPIIKKELSNTTPKKIIKSQLRELAENYGDIYVFWMDMYCWCDSSLKIQEIYDLLKNSNPKAFVHFNQHVQDGSEISYFPTDILNGEERIPPLNGHQSTRIINGNKYYLPFEYEITSQFCKEKTLGNGLMQGSVWFTYQDSRFYPVDSLFKYIKASYMRGGSNILLSTAPDKNGIYKKSDVDSLWKLGNLIRSLYKN